MVLAELTSPRFHDLIGSILKPEFFPSEEAKHLVMAAHSVAIGGNPCSSPTLAMQSLMSLHDDGKLKIEDVNACEEYISTCDPVIARDIEAIIRSLAPIIQKIEGKLVVQNTLLAIGKEEAPLDDIASDFQKIADIGKKKMTMGVGLVATEAAIDTILTRRLIDPLPTGIDELDTILGGGLEKKALGAVVAPSSAGKSFFLCHVAVEALLQGHNVAYLSLELSEEQVLERIVANLTDMTIENMLRNRKQAADRLGQWQNEGIGKFRVIHETPRATTPRHFEQWLKMLDESETFCQVMVCDFADKMVSKLGTKRSGYDDAGVVYDALRDLAFDRDGWGWTASQAKGEAYGKKKVNATHFADSLNKLRSLDLAIGLARTEEDEENEQVRFSIPKRRAGEGYFETVGPLDWDPARGRIAYVSGRPNPWEN